MISCSLVVLILIYRRHNPEEGGASNTFENLRRAMEREEKPSLNQALERANPKLKFLSDCFQYVAVERPSTTFVLRGLTQILAEVKRDRKSSLAGNTSFIFP